MDLIEYIHSLLVPVGVPALLLIRPKDNPCISYHTFDESGGLYGDGEAKTISGSLQVDIFVQDTSEIRSLRKKVIAALKTSKAVVFMKSTPDETSFEDDVKLFHHVIVFNFEYYNESEVI